MRIIDTSTLISYDVFTLVLLCLTKSQKRHPRGIAFTIVSLYSLHDVIPCT
jgi:hypothetical protein